MAAAGLEYLNTVEQKRTVQFSFLHQPLLVEIERRCSFSDCHARSHVGLTKSEAIEYRGFECTQCERWNDDQLKSGEIPDAWLDQFNQQS